MLFKPYSLSRLGADEYIAGMVDTFSAVSHRRRQRSDARRSLDAIFEAAGTILGERPDASMEEIAAMAGVTRQTVYAHFPSRDTLISAIIEMARAEALADLDDAQLENYPPAEAMRRFLDISWQLLDRCPLLLDPALARTSRPDGSDPHEVVGARLEQVIRRGQRQGVFDRILPATWLAAAIFGLGHSAAEQVAAGRVSTRKATSMLLKSTLRLCGALDA
jgi:AcrR family transcriptional regulator